MTSQTRNLNLSVETLDVFIFAAHGLLHGVIRDSERVVQGPPGPPGLPGAPGHTWWVSSTDNMVDVVEYLKCESMRAAVHCGVEDLMVT